MTPNHPRVSIGLPVFNGEKYLEQAIESILIQTYPDFELIISDNASTDRTAEICQGYSVKDQRIRYYRNKKNLGASPNFNRVFALSSGEYFKWAPYDDLIAPDFLKSCVNILDQKPEVILCYSRVKIIDENSLYVVDYDPGPATGSPLPHERFRNLILHPEYAVQQMGLFRSEAIKRTALYGSFPSSDEVFLAELALIGDFYEIPERLYFYRRHAEQSTQGKQRSRRLFFDTSLKGKVILPKWIYFFASLKVIKHSLVSGKDKAHCYSHMLRWALKPPNFRALGKDILIASYQLISRALSISGSKVEDEKFS